MSPRVGSRVALEAVKASVASPIPSVGALVVTAAMCLGILLTDGRTVGAQLEVLQRIDDAGTTSVVIRADPQAALPASFLTRLKGIDGIGWAVAMGPATDVTNSQIDGGTRVPLRRAWSLEPASLGLGDTSSLGISHSWASPVAAKRLGMPHGYGGVRSDVGESFAVVRTFTAPRELTFLEPLLLAPGSSRHGWTSTSTDPVTVVVVRATEPAVVVAIERVVRSFLDTYDPALVEISTSGETAALRGQVQDTLARAGKSLVTAILALSGLLLGLVWSAVVMLKRRDFGRRRAIGASQRLIVLLVLLQVAFIGVGGASIGTLAAALSLALSGDPLPTPAYFVAVAVFAIVISLVAALVPALLAARRDPLRELRVP